MKQASKAMTVRQAALALGVSMKHLYDLVWEGKLPAKKTDGKWVVLSEGVEQRIRRTRHAGK
jgi:excisionase family DNA binding protein